MRKMEQNEPKNDGDDWSTKMTMDMKAQAIAASEPKATIKIVPALSDIFKMMRSTRPMAQGRTPALFGGRGVNRLSPALLLLCTHVIGQCSVFREHVIEARARF